LKSAFWGACAPGVRLRRRGEYFSVGAGRPLAEGLCADWNRPSQALRAGRRPSPTRRVFSVGAGRPLAEGPQGRIHSTR